MADKSGKDRIRVEFEGTNRVLEVRPGHTILELARRARVDIYSPCGGEGQCGRCAVRVEGDVERLSPPPPHMDPAMGLLLACQTRPVGDVVVTVPESSRPGAARILTESREGIVELSPMAFKRFVELPVPTVSDNVCDLMRLSRGLGLGLREVDVRLPLLRRMGEYLREASWRVTATASQTGVTPRLFHLEAGDTSARSFGLAIDIGTTTVVGKLVSLVDGSVVATAARENGQIPYGEDVIARIHHANESDQGLEELRAVVQGTISDVVSELLTVSGTQSEEVLAACLAGNTTMEHLYLGVPPRSIRLEPYVPTFCQLSELTAQDVGLQVNPSAAVLLLPCRAGFVGGDITADVLACGMHKREQTAMMIDVGTNGEVVLGNKEWLMACSCSAGPAFEGGEVRHGMRAGAGAIERIELDSKGGVRYQTIGDAKPRGICGSGLIDLAAELFYHGYIDRAGNFVREDNRVLTLDLITYDAVGKAFVVATGDETAVEGPVFVTEEEVKNLLRTKGAMYAACSQLVKAAGIEFGDLDRIYISGGFGRFLDSWKARLLGLLPDIDEWRYEFIGNGSVEGARLALLSRKAREESRSIFANMTYLELSVSASFMDEFTSALFIPHTDLDRFPSVKRDLERRDRP